MPRSAWCSATAQRSSGFCDHTNLDLEERSLMQFVALVTLALFFVLIVAIAFYLIVIAYVLYDVTFTLGTILIGVRSIAYQTEPVGDVVNGILGDVKAIEGALGDLVAGAGRPAPPARRPLSARGR